MALQTFNVGSTANDGTGETVRAAFQKASANATETESRLAGIERRVTYKAPADLIASTEVARGVGSIWLAGEYEYEEVASGGHVTTAAGVNLKVLPGADGLGPVGALGVDATGAADVTAKVQALLDGTEGLLVPVGTYRVKLTNTAKKTIVGADRSRSILTSAADATGTTITVGADIELRNLTVQGHPTDANSKTISHTGAYKVTAHNVTFTGTNHSPAGGIDAAGDYKNCLFHSTVFPASLGPLCWSPSARFSYCRFTGGRTVDARSSKFHFCEIGDQTTNTAVHMPDGATNNAGTATGYTEPAEFWDCIILSGNDGITEGNAARAKLRRTFVKVTATGLYARSASTFDAEECTIQSTDGTAVSFSDLQGPGNIPRSGESIFRRCEITSFSPLTANKSLAMPTTADIYPAAIGNVLLYDCHVNGGDTKITPKDGTYHVFKTDRSQDVAATVEFAANGETKRLRFKGNDMLVRVYGTDAAKTGCFLSHIDAATGEPIPSGSRIIVRYGGTSSRFVTFASGNTAEGGQMYFRANASTWQADQNGIAMFYLQGVAWRQL